jgi:hypothetical protein
VIHQGGTVNRLRPVQPTVQMRRAFFARVPTRYIIADGKSLKAALSVDSEEPMAQATTDGPLGGMVAFCIV